MAYRRRYRNYRIAKKYRYKDYKDVVARYGGPVAMHRFQRPIKSTLYRSRLNAGSTVHAYKRRVILYGKDGPSSSFQVAPGVGFNSLGLQFQLSDLPNVSEFNNLYDFFKLNYIVIKIIWQANMTDSQNVASSGTAIPRLIWVIDHDDAVAPAATQAGATTLREYAKSKTFDFGTRRTCTIKFKPSILTENYVSGIATGYTVSYNKWIDMANNTMPHYGLKAVMMCGQSTGTNTEYAQYFDIECTYYFQCKDPR